jgi:hypothetical protein
MNPTQRHFIAAGLLLIGVGCASYDDSKEQSEFEKLRKYPISPQGDRILPNFGSELPSEEEESLRFAIYSEGRIQRPFAEKIAQKSPPQASSLLDQHFSIDNLLSKRLSSE